ncbi:hypothetical protein ER308_10685 [Egibacter rhizosphaerae]|uniref:Uncharacterized protein n=1 Tax=Egibacter rhizosphaerae TaxID=1670831 RepID=A0A411YFM7_9ACTN|nr:hypothetical protein [Egibacter rhizosphaerae]QBI19979.1 hypothetical protein ER308_10685 [Egibacter rhizosphaerae]
MPDDPRRWLHDAAAEPTGPAAFDLLWASGRRRRRRRQAALGGSVTALVAAVVAVVPMVAGPWVGDDATVRLAGGSSGEGCPVTELEEARFSPPDPYPAEPPVDDGMWYGTAELWTVLVDDASGGLKSVWWSADFEGGADEPEPDIEVAYERLDAPGADPVVLGPPGTNAYEYRRGWFMIAGMTPTDPGCWRVTATYRDAELTYVYAIDDEE